MLGAYWLSWWYSAGWIDIGRKLKSELASLWSSFSVGLLFKTLFQPWRQVVSYGSAGANIGERFQAVIANFVSRIVGLVMRLFTLLAALVVTVLFAAIGFILLLAWPLLPLAAIYLILKGIGLL